MTRDPDEQEEFEAQATERFRAMLDETYGPINVAGHWFDASDVLGSLDPIAFRTYLNDFIDSEEKNQ